MGLAPPRQRQAQSVSALQAPILNEHQRRQFAAWLLREPRPLVCRQRVRRGTRELTTDSQASRSTGVSSLSDEAVPANPCASVGPYGTGTRLPMEQWATSRTDYDVTLRAGGSF